MRGWKPHYSGPVLRHPETNPRGGAACLRVAWFTVAMLIGGSGDASSVAAAVVVVMAVVVAATEGGRRVILVATIMMMAAVAIVVAEMIVALVVVAVLKTAADAMVGPGPLVGLWSRRRTDVTEVKETTEVALAVRLTVNTITLMTKDAGKVVGKVARAPGHNRDHLSPPIRARVGAAAMATIYRRQPKTPHYPLMAAHSRRMRLRMGQ